MKTRAALIGGGLAGAALAYLADPTVGRRRRALLRDTATHDRKVLGHAMSVTGRDIAHRTKGVFEWMRRMVRPDAVDDARLTDHVRTEVGRVCSHPNVEVFVKDRRVLLQGPVISHERRQILRAARSVRGVEEVEDRMEPYEPPSSMPTQAMRERQPDIMQRHWSPATRVLAGMTGSVLSVAGARSGGIRGAIPAVVGFALLLRSVTNTELREIIRRQRT
ncbi:MAG TPA: BON domain-containing protein [Terriglobia bacterium]|nr:BON domain-containing protein [Terriglobia bacterium]